MEEAGVMELLNWSGQDSDFDIEQCKEHCVMERDV